MADQDIKMTAAGNLPVPENHYCPSEIVDIFSDFLSRAGLGSKVVFVTGVYMKTARQQYGNYWYDTLRDQNSDQELSLMMPQGLRDDIEQGSLVTVGGTIYKKAGNKGNIQLGFKVSRVETLQQQAVSEEDMKRSELRNRKTQKGFSNVDAILENILMKGERPKVALIFASSSITMSDFDAGKHAAEASIDFTEYRANFASPSELCGTLAEADGAGFDVLALVRGGGSGIEHLDDLAVIEAVVGLKTPLICAVGHVEEKIFIKLVSDKVAPTPNGLGSWFSETAEKVTKTRQDSIAVITEQVKKQFQERLDVQTKQNKELQEKLSTLTKQAGETQKQNADASKKMQEQHASDNKKLQEQLAEANKKNGELAETIKGLKESSEKQTKEHSQQLQTLNQTIEGFKKESASQAAKQGEVLSGLQKSNAELLQKNTEANKALAASQAKVAELQNNRKSPALTIILAVVAVILLIALILK